MTEGPHFRRTSGITTINVTGYLMPSTEDRQPVLCSIPGTDDLFVLLFSNKLKLDTMMAIYGIKYARIQQIMDGEEFLDSINEENKRGVRTYQIRVAVDAYKHENGRMRFTDVSSVED